MFLIDLSYLRVPLFRAFEACPNTKAILLLVPEGACELVPPDSFRFLEHGNDFGGSVSISLSLLDASPMVIVTGFERVASAHRVLAARIQAVDFLFSCTSASGSEAPRVHDVVNL
jgi:hypothetical protein